MRWRRPLGAALLVAAATASCSDDRSASPLPGAAELRGTPFLVPRPAAPESADPVPVPPEPAPPMPAPEPSPPPPAEPEPVSPAVLGEALKVTIVTLSAFEMPEPELDELGRPKPAKPDADPVPKSIRELSGRRIEIDGYILPIEYEDGVVTKFMLSMMPPGCCYHCVARPNNWVEVTMLKGTKAEFEDRWSLMRVTGVLTVHGIGADSSPMYTMKGDTFEVLE